MKKLIFLLLFVPSFLFSQTEFTGLSAGKCNIQQTGSGAGYWQVGITQFNNPRGMDATYIAEGDVLYFNDSGVSFALPVDTVLSAVGNSASVRVLNSGITTISSVPTTAAGIAMGTSNYKIPPFFANMTDNNNQMVVEWAMYVIDSLIANSGSSTIYNASDSLRDTLRIVDMDRTAQELYLGDFDDPANNQYYGSNVMGLYISGDNYDGSVGMSNTKNGSNSYFSLYNSGLNFNTFQGVGSISSVNQGFDNLNNGAFWITRQTSGSSIAQRFEKLDSLQKKIADVIEVKNEDGNIGWSGFAYNNSGGAMGSGFNLNNTVYGNTNLEWRMSYNTFPNIKVVLEDSTSDNVQFYGKYALENSAPSNTSGAISEHTWTGDGTSPITSFTRKARGNASGSTDGSGDLVVTCVMPDAGYVVNITPTGSTLGVGYTVTTKGSSSFTVRAFDTSTKAAITSTAVTFDWTLVDN